jgi:phospho-N-acetylmuramoyl-pentapeptide-transferase
MLLHLLYPLHDSFSIFNVFRYITFRTAGASLTALALSLLLGPWLIRRLRAFQVGQVIRTDGPQSHQPKAGTPTMGGVLIVASVVLPTLLWADSAIRTSDCGRRDVWIRRGGFVDDYSGRIRTGLFARYKFTTQAVVALTIGLSLML